MIMIFTSLCFEPLKPPTPCTSKKNLREILYTKGGRWQGAIHMKGIKSRNLVLNKFDPWITTLNLILKSSPTIYDLSQSETVVAISINT
jgi:hypothetical protein